MLFRSDVALLYVFGVISVGVYGGVNLRPQAAEVAAGADLIVGTPGRIVDLLATGVLKPKSIKKLKKLALQKSWGNRRGVMALKHC